MIYAGRYANVGPSLGFLGIPNPFKLIGKAVSAVKGAIKGGTTITLPSGGVIQTGQGGASYTPGGKSPMQQFQTGVEGIPGGWGTIAAVGAGALLVGVLLSRRGR